MTNAAGAEQSKIDQEILDAKAGLVASVSRNAAARYLGISKTSLSRLVLDGDGPPVYKALALGPGKNQHMHFPFRELEMWNDARVLYPNPRKRRLLIEEAERARLRHELWELEERAELIRKRLRASGDSRGL